MATIASAVAILTATGLISAFAPAWRASRIDPAVKAASVASVEHVTPNVNCGASPCGGGGAPSC